MNVDRLLAHYERIVDAPDAVPRLRRFILDLAVRGKLVAQDPRDEPASKLLERRQIAVSRAEPFELPASWVWVNVGAVAVARLGKMLDKAKNIGTPRRYLRNINVRWFDFDLSNLLEMRFEDSELPEFMLRFDDVLICEGGEPGRAAVWDGRQNDIYFQKAIHRIRLMNIVDSRFFVKALRASADDGRLAEYFTGTGIKHFTGKGLAAYLFPLPPLAEQHRIVAKVDELMALCDRLEVARTRREATRDRLSASSLVRLNAPDPDPMVFRNHAAFALEHLTPLTTCRDQIKALRQTILNLAVRGKLVAQDPNDEPASRLLERITKEKARLATLRGIGREKPLPPISDDQTELEIPNGWSWCRLGSLSKFVTSGSRDWAKYYSQEGAIFVRMGNLSKAHYRLRLDQIQRVKLPSDQEGTRTRLETGDLLISITGDVGMLGLITENFGEAYINQHTAMVRPVDEMKGRYLAELFRSPFAQNQFNAPQRGIKNSFRLTDVTQFLVPLPPIDEQHRIVAKLDELMALCDRLEASLATGDDTRCRLLGALLTEALEPGESHASAQAERVVAHG